VAQFAELLAEKAAMDPHALNAAEERCAPGSHGEHAAEKDDCVYAESTGA
jgi:hypothetical protein